MSSTEPTQNIELSEIEQTFKKIVSEYEKSFADQTSKLAKMLVKEFKDKSDAEGDFVAMLVQDFLEKISLYSFKHNLDLNDAEYIAEKWSRDYADWLRENGVPGVVWENIEAAIKSKIQKQGESLTSEYKAIFENYHVMLAREEIKKRRDATCCC